VHVICARAHSAQRGLLAESGATDQVGEDRIYRMPCPPPSYSNCIAARGRASEAGRRRQIVAGDDVGL
jgi:hypothetical protein